MLGTRRICRGLIEVFEIFQGFENISVALIADSAPMEHTNY